jgi:hypothetical protein
MQLIQKPQPLLRKRQRHITTTGPRRWPGFEGRRSAQSVFQIRPPSSYPGAYFISDGTRWCHITKAVLFKAQANTPAGQQCKEVI